MGGQLAGKTAIVTGSTSGIGKATALLYAQEGANVVVTGRRAELGAQVVEEIKARGGSALYVRTDVGVAEDLRAMVRSAVEAYGRLDILVNNAISFIEGSAGSVLEVTEEGWDVVLRTGLTAIFLACKFAIPEMIKAGGGAIINMSSVHGLMAGFGMCSYNTVKAGILNLTRALAMDFGRYGIRVNAICPGYIITERELAWKQDARYASMMRYKDLTTPTIYPLGRAGRPEEVAQACLFLASEASSFVTGATLAVDGGLSIQVHEALINPLAELFRETYAKEWGIDPHSQAGDAQGQAPTALHNPTS